MDCESYIPWISARLDGMLTVEQTRELERHLARCPACRALEAQLAALHDPLEHMEELQAPEGFAKGVMERVRAEEAEMPKVVPLARRPRFRALAGLAACAVLCVGLYQGRFLGSGQNAETAPAALRSAAAEQTGDAQSETGSEDGLLMPANVEVAPAAQENATLYAAAQAELAFRNDQYIPVSYGSTPAAPYAMVLDSADSLADFAAQFQEDDLSAVTEVYDADFFRTGRLLAVVVEEGSGSVTHQIAGLTRDLVTILRQVPESGTCDMASWLILAEVDGPFENGSPLAVEFTE